MNYEELLYSILEKDDRFVVMTAENRAALRSLPPKIKERFIDVGIAEQTMIGMAAGLALRGRIPIVHALSAFLTMRAFEFIRTDVGIGNLPVKLVGSVAGFLSEANGPAHQALEDIHLMRGIPGMNIFAPADENDMLLCLPQILNSPSPSYIRFNNTKAVVDHAPFAGIGKAEVLSHGDDVAIITYGILLKEALTASEVLKEKGYSVSVINLRSIKPIDKELIIRTCRQSRLIVILEDHFITGGVFSIISEILAMERITAHIMPFALKDKWFKPLLLNNLLKHEGFSGGHIAAEIFKELHKSN